MLSRLINSMRFLISSFACLALFAGVHMAPGLAHAEKLKSPTGMTSNKSVTVYAAGDIADCKKNVASETMAAKTAELIMNGLAKDSKALVITLGDNTYPVGRPEEFNECYDPTWGQFKSRTLPSPGNHDYGMPLALGYYNYFDELAGPDRRGYYRKSAGRWALISLNSNLDGVQMQEQLSWLKEELRESKAACTLAFWHHPVISSGGHGNNDVMKDAWKLLAEAKADVVLASHDHNYERLVPINADGVRDEKYGIRSFVVGTGGVKLTPMFFSKPTTEIRDNDTHGVLKLTLNANSYDWEFLPVAGKTFTDKGHGACH
jgi:hypothetical protein